jgi:hypothetical protein
MAAGRSSLDDRSSMVASLCFREDDRDERSAVVKLSLDDR